MSIRGVFGVVMVTGLLLTTVGVILAADSDIVISEVMINATDDTNGEWFEIYNKGAAAEDIDGWSIVDNTFTDTISTNMCPGNSCVVGAGDCWLVARSQSGLQSELDHYTNPFSPTVQTTRTIFINSAIGGGLNNTADILILRENSVNQYAVDCVSWGMTTFCSPLTYVSGGGGNDQTNTGSQNQSITNIQGAWHNHQSNASPYDCINTADGGPTAVRLLKIAVTRRVPALLGMGMVLLALVGLVITRRRA